MPYEKNEDDQNTIIGTKDENSQMEIPKIVRKVVDPKDLNVMKDVLLDCDVIIYDLQTAKFSDVEFAIKTLKINSGDSEKVCFLSQFHFSFGFSIFLGA